MSNDPQQPQGGLPPNDPQSITQQVNYSHISARIPEKIGKGTFATNVLVLTGAQEVVCDFLQRLVPPVQLAARVVIPYTAMQPMVKAMQDNVDNFRARFGNPPPLPLPPPNTPPPNIGEIYEQMKIADEISLGGYANMMMITHSACEFCCDFIMDVFPKPVVTNRIYLAAPQMVSWLETMKRTMAQIQARQGNPPSNPTAGNEPSGK